MPNSIKDGTVAAVWAGATISILADENEREEPEQLVSIGVVCD
jgi:hypothetical protein